MTQTTSAKKPRSGGDKKPKDWRSAGNIKWLEQHIIIPEGKNAGRPFRMAEFMKEDFRAIYDNPAGTRRAILSRGRKNAKTFEAAIIVLNHLAGIEALNNSQIFSTALSRDQAAILFGLAAKMVRLDAYLSSMVVVRETRKELFCPEYGNVYRALSAEATTAFGLSPSLVVHDELGQVKGPRSTLYEAMETATAAQARPMTIIISTQAPTDADLLSILIDDAKALHDPQTVLRFNTAEPEMDPFSIEAIEAANPALNVFMNRKEVLAMAESAKRMPARQAEYENLILNRRVVVNNPFISQIAWQACGFPVDEEGLRHTTVYAGLDLSAVSDLTALVLIGRVNEKWHVKPTFWLPSEGLREKSEISHVPYDLWHQEGFLETTPGATVAYEYVAGYLRKVFDEYNIAKLAFDRWNFKFLKPWLLKAGFTEMGIADKFVEFGQGTQSMSPALRALEEMTRDKQLAHGNHKVLNMNAACAVVEAKDEANRRLSKNKSTGRIDGLVALAMAVGVAPLHTQGVDVESIIG